MDKRTLESNLSIRRLRMEDWEFLRSCDDILQWGFSHDDPQFHLSICHSAFIAEIERMQVGVVFGYKWGSNVGWIGQLIVKEEFRQQGIGRTLLRREINELHNSGCTTIGLDAVPAMIQFYESEGFSCYQKSLRFNLPWTKGHSHKSIKYATKGDLNTIFRFDKEITRLNRFKLLKNTLNCFPDNMLVHISDGQLAGYLAFRYRPNLVQIGPWISQSQKAAEELLQHFFYLSKMKQKIIRAGALKKGITSDILKNFGFKEVFSSHRMFWGPALPSANSAFICIGDPAWG
ncbi:MAG: GNAT family N-acetyltransferase [Candidatus Hodarchaeales archaeon]